jgi:putative ABC transport system substrate-binding protein
MRHRDLIFLLGGLAAAWPLAAHAQPQSGDQCKQGSQDVRVIGFLNPASAEAIPQALAGFRQGLRDAGYIEDQNIIIDYRWANGRYELLPDRAKQLVDCKVELIAATGGTKSAQAAKEATAQAATDPAATIPIVFATGFDPVKTRLVPSYDRPDGNATGIAMHTAARVETRVELLRKLVPPSQKIALLQNPSADVRSLQADLPPNLVSSVLRASDEAALNEKFREAADNGYDGIVVSADPFLGSRRAQIVALAAQHRLRAIYPWREYVEAGGLMSYGVNFANTYRQIGLYAGRILNGAHPAGLPVLHPPDFSVREREVKETSRFELAINLTTARTLGVTLPLELIQRANHFVGR